MPPSNIISAVSQRRMKNVYLYCKQLLSLSHAVRRQLVHNNTPITSSQTGETPTTRVTRRKMAEQTPCVINYTLNRAAAGAQPVLSPWQRPGQQIRCRAFLFTDGGYVLIITTYLIIEFLLVACNLTIPGFMLTSSHDAPGNCAIFIAIRNYNTGSVVIPYYRMCAHQKLTF
jgi:hypothetical protein